MLTAEHQFVLTFLKSQAIPSLCHCENGTDQIPPADIIMEFNCRWHTLMKNAKPCSSLPCATIEQQQMPCLEMSIWQLGIGDISSTVRGAGCMERMLWVPFRGLGRSASSGSHFICLCLYPCTVAATFSLTDECISAVWFQARCKPFQYPLPIYPICRWLMFL